MNGTHEEEGPMVKIGFLILISSMVACAPKKLVVKHEPPVQRESIKKDWTADLAVSPGTSMDGGQKQVIRLKTKKDFREFEGKFWVAGKGFATINGGSGAYFWGSSTPPQLEIEVSDDSKNVLDGCKQTVMDKFTDEKMLFLEGEGFFRGMEKPQGFLGVFKMFKISKCEVGSPADYGKGL